MSNFKRNITVGASAALSAVLGTVHAFSVFIPQWEELPGADRASLSLVYSIALVSLTIAVLLGYRIYQRIPPFAVFAIVGLLSATGLAMSASSLSVVSLYLAYGLLFGGANGLGYGYALQLSGQAAPGRRGFAMGLVTAFYAVGATFAPLLFVSLIEQGGNALALKAMSAIILIVSLVAAALVSWSNARYDSEPNSAKQTLNPMLKHVRALLWVGYGSAVTGNMLGGFSAGYYADRVASQTLLRWLPLLTSLGLILLVWPAQTVWITVFIALGLVGYCYGSIIAVYPVVVSDVFGALAAPRIYGQIFTAWGLAGLLGPWVSGWLFDFTGSYTLPLVIAVLLSGVSVVSSCVRRQPIL